MLASPSGKRLSVLLASASSGGTIAAVRCLGGFGVNVRVISSDILGAAAWSRYTKASYTAPKETDYRRFLERLLAIGQSNPGQILLSTSDETAWLYTANASLLQRCFHVYQPSVSTIERLLDKDQFSKAASDAGIAVLPSWDPLKLDDLSRLAPSLPYPILIKPRTHVHRRRNDKGIVVQSRQDLIPQYRRFLARELDRDVDHAYVPDAKRPILQQFVNVGREGVHSVSGFIDRTGDLFVTRRSRKVFQRMQPLGVGVCFKSLPNDPDLSLAIYQLCRAVGYFGIFEIEFIRFDGRWVAIDFNPRFYNQMAMDIRRGMPLPLLACLDASGDMSSLREIIETVQIDEETTRTVFSDAFTLRAILLAKTMTSQITTADRQYWRRWTARKSVSAVDVAADRSDPVPGIVHAVSELCLGLAAIPRFARAKSPTIRGPVGMLTKVRS